MILPTKEEKIKNYSKITNGTLKMVKIFSQVNALQTVLFLKCKTGLKYYFDQSDTLLTFISRINQSFSQSEQFRQVIPVITLLEILLEILTVLFQKVSFVLWSKDYFVRTRIIFAKIYVYVCMLTIGNHVGNWKLKQYNNIRKTVSNITKKALEVI